MREIKFRAWQKYHKKMVEVTRISFDDTGEINGVTTFVENQAPQYINYKDKKAKEKADTEQAKEAEQISLAEEVEE